MLPTSQNEQMYASLERWINTAQKTLPKHDVCAFKKERGWGSVERVGEGRLLIGGVHWKLEAVGLGVSENPRLSTKHKFIQLTIRRLVY